MVEPVKREGHDRKTHKRCIKCRQWKRREPLVDEEGQVVEKAGFGKHNSSDGLQSICHACKNKANNEARNRNVNQRIRHHTATRCLKQLGDLAPEGFTKNIEDYLGYKIRHLVAHLREDLKSREGSSRSLRDALDEGYHIDHIKPLSTFEVIVPSEGLGDDLGDPVVDWDTFRECWDIHNLTAIPGKENLEKGAKWDG